MARVKRGDLLDPEFIHRGTDRTTVRCIKFNHGPTCGACETVTSRRKRSYCATLADASVTDPTTNGRDVAKKVRRSGPQLV